ncbi:MAG: hypothetical protein QOJ07_3905 [Thermoleophilaceae bacterium]|nr:hypothetical protein [Thermoleophilaceae bacterium]
MVMAVEPHEGRSQHGVMSVSISNALVRLFREYTGRGPTRARTSIRDDVVLVLLEDGLTKGEKVLVDNGRENAVLEIRHEFQGAMREDAIAAVEGLTGRKVRAMMSANSVDPDIAAELFVLDGRPDGTDTS